MAELEDEITALKIDTALNKKDIESEVGERETYQKNLNGNLKTINQRLWRIELGIVSVLLSTVGSVITILVAKVYGG